MIAPAESTRTAARLKDVPNSRRPSKRRWRALRRSDRNSSASADGSSIPSTPPRSNASERARPLRPTGSASKPRSSPPTPALPVASSCSTPRHCPATQPPGSSLKRNRAEGCINAIALRLPVIQRGLSGTKPGPAYGGWRTYRGCAACTHSTSTASDRSIGGWLGQHGQRPTPN
jgi:hypothetical protein